MKVNSKIDRLVDDPDTSIKAFASVTLDGMFAVHGFKVIEGKDKIFVNMPSVNYTDKEGNTQYRDIFHGITKSAYEAIQRSVLNAYGSAVEQRQRSEIEVTAEESPDEELEEEPDNDFSMQ